MVVGEVALTELWGSERREDGICHTRVQVVVRLLYLVIRYPAGRDFSWDS